MACSVYAAAVHRGGGVKDELEALLLAAFDHHRLNVTFPGLAKNEYGGLFGYLLGALDIEVVCIALTLVSVLFCVEIYFSCVFLR